MPFAILAVVLRFIAVRRLAVNHQSEDWLALASLIAYLAFDGITLAGMSFSPPFNLPTDRANLAPLRLSQNRWQWSRHIGSDERPRRSYDGEKGSFRPPKPRIKHEITSKTPQLMYSALWAYVWQQLFAKFSIMALYYRLFHVNRSFSLRIHALMIYHIAWVVAASVIMSVQCQPLSRFWNPLIPGKCIGETTSIAIVESINSFGDFLLVALAMSMVRILQISQSNRWKLRILFGSGALAGIFGFLKVGLSFQRSQPSLCEFQLVFHLDSFSLHVSSGGLTNSEDTFTTMAVWSNVQAAVCIVCCCAPVYKPILPGPHFWRRLKAKASLAYIKPDRSHSNGPDEPPRNPSTKRRVPSCDRREYDWLVRDNGSSLGLVWAERHGQESNASSSHGVVYPLEVITVQRDVDVFR